MTDENKFPKKIDSPDDLREKISCLEREISKKDKELKSYHQQMAEANRRLEKVIQQVHQEIKLAHLIHRSLVPVTFPNISGFEFSTKFVPSNINGGDYFDIFEHDGRARFGIFLSSASGYSLSSLLMSIFIKWSTRERSKIGLEAHDLVYELAETLAPNIQEKHTIDIFYALVDRRNYEMYFCSLGKIVGYHYIYATRQLHRLEPHGHALTQEMLPDRSAQASRLLHLSPRDRIILCSDGLVGAKDQKNNSFGETRLRNIIMGSIGEGVHELRNEILFQSDKFLDGLEAQRDRTVLVIEVNERILRLAKM